MAAEGSRSRRSGRGWSRPPGRGAGTRGRRSWGGGRLPGRLSGLPPAPGCLLWPGPCADPRRGPLRPCPATRLPPGTPAASGAAQTHEARAPLRRCRRDGAPGPRGGAEDQCGSGIGSSGESAAGRVLTPAGSRALAGTGSWEDPSLAISFLRAARDLRPGTPRLLCLLHPLAHPVWSLRSPCRQGCL